MQTPLDADAPWMQTSLDAEPPMDPCVTPPSGFLDPVRWQTLPMQTAIPLPRYMGLLREYGQQAGDYASYWNDILGT